MDRFDQGDLIGDTCYIGNGITEPGTVLSMPGEFEHRSDAGEGFLPGGHAGDALSVTDAVG